MDFKEEEVSLANRNPGLRLEALSYDQTPAEFHFQLSHFDVPCISEDEGRGWRVAYCAPNHPEEAAPSIPLSQIKAMPKKELLVTLECAGNGRRLLPDRHLSQPWGYEAVSTAAWAGTPLLPLLTDLFGNQLTGTHLVFRGADHGIDEGIEQDYSRSLAFEQIEALGDNILLAWEMNGHPLPRQHGFPLRLIVPGWYGMASVKWLSRIELWSKPYDGFFQTGTYLYKYGGRIGPVTTMKVKSLIRPPGVSEWFSQRRIVTHHGNRPLPLTGRAWSGAGTAIVKVEVGVDGHFQEAELGPNLGPYAWQSWKFMEWTPTPGTHILECRAIDASGATQPPDGFPNAKGFGNNLPHRLIVEVRSEESIRAT